ncbi:MAG TPA: SMC-Scp complex subunit ScpB, partial [Rhodospirillaceae bacterium]|nr:SMC-Scp complex subunit ScpB [Rhodospirillaceae bacterium]
MSDDNDTVVLDADEAQSALDNAGLRRLVEALLFAATEPVPMGILRERLPAGTDLGAILEDLQTLYQG